MKKKNIVILIVVIVIIVALGLAAQSFDLIGSIIRLHGG